MKKLKLNSILLFLLLFITNVHAQNPPLQWAKNFGGNYYLNALGFDIAVDPSGNVYTTGGFSDTTDFDPGPGTFTLIADSYDIFVTKLDAYGNFVWAKSFGGAAYDFGNSLVVDSIGNVYVTGYFSLTSDFDPGAGTYTLASAGYSDIFISKLDPTGNFVWAKRIGGGANDIGQSIALDKTGTSVYTTGYFEGPVDFDPGSGTFSLNIALFNEDVFVSKLDASGNFIWAKNMGGSGYDEGYGISVDLAGNVYTTGYFQGVSDFDPGAATSTLSSNGGNDIFVSKLNSSGNFVWAKNLGGASSDYGRSIAADDVGNVYTTGYYNLNGDYDPGPGTFTLTSSGNQDVFISKLDVSGNFVWAKSIGGTGYEEGSAIAVDKVGNVYTTGYFENTVDFDPNLTTSTLSAVSGAQDVFISKLDALGNFIWGKDMGGNGPLSINYAGSITLDTSDNIYTTGTFLDTVDFDPGNGIYNLIALNSQNNVYVQKLSTCVIPSPPLITSTSNLNVCAGESTTLIAIGTGTINWYNSLNPSVILGTGAAFPIVNNAVSTYSFYAQASSCMLSQISAPISVTVNACTDVENLNEKNNVFSIFPNPAHSTIVVDLGDNNKLQILNIVGQLVREIDLQKGENAIDLSELANGVYYFKLLQGGLEITKKVIKN